MFVNSACLISDEDGHCDVADGCLPVGVAFTLFERSDEVVFKSDGQFSRGHFYIDSVRHESPGLVVSCGLLRDSCVADELPNFLAALRVEFGGFLLRLSERGGDFLRLHIERDFVLGDERCHLGFAFRVLPQAVAKLLLQRREGFCIYPADDTALLGLSSDPLGCIGDCDHLDPAAVFSRA